MPFECPDCRSHETVEGAFFEMCGRCGWSSVDHNEHAKMLQQAYRERWRDKPVHFWVYQLMKHTCGVASASVGGPDSPIMTWELINLKAICGNFLVMLEEKR